MIRFLKKCFTFLVAAALMLSFAYFVLLPRILPRDYADIVGKYAARYELDEAFVDAVIFCESRFEADVVSPAGAMGLMQVTQETGWWAAQQIGLDTETLDLHDPETNIRIGCWYLHWLEEKFDGVPETMLAGYNAGHGNVAKWLADEEKSRDGITLDEIPYQETRSYVRRVGLVEKLYRLLYQL